MAQSGTGFEEGVRVAIMLLLVFSRIALQRSRRNGSWQRWRRHGNGNSRDINIGYIVHISIADVHCTVELEIVRKVLSAASKAGVLQPSCQ